MTTEISNESHFSATLPLSMQADGGNEGSSGDDSLGESIQLDEIQFRSLLKQLSESAGCMAELARRLDVSGQFLGDVIAGRKNPGPKLLSALGAEATIIYRIPLISTEGG